MKYFFNLFALFLLGSFIGLRAQPIVTSREYHVALNGNDTNDGSRAMPFLTINRAASLAVAGDTITVHEGTYREWVKPARGGESDIQRIVYRSAPGEKVEIKGSERITNWKREKSGIWKVVISNDFFGDYNPYKDSVYGDWFNNHGRVHHTGEVFLNNKSLYEKETLAKVINPVADSNIKDPEGSLYTWYCESDELNTTIWANFREFNPNKELTEISARKTCIYPEKPWINYITISGFHISQAATQWGAPTAEQVGMVATHWNKGWIIENNVISNSKCSGITLGKERGTGHNVWSADRGNIYNDGNIHYIEVTFRVLRNGWSKENTGSHIIRNNIIYACEQTGICGSMGAAFSIIENNHIFDIYTKRQFSGAEIGGIKFHAAIDAVIRNNRIHDVGRGIWLDWMTQGTRVSSNIFYNNDMEDLFLEVNHGPFVVDNNVFLSPVSIRTQSEGGAFVHNLITGRVQAWPDPNRFTPYFLPHSTDMAGLITVMGGDDRYYNNLIVGGGTTGESGSTYGLSTYDKAKLPVWLRWNVYFHGALPSMHDVDAISSATYNPEIRLITDGGNGYLEFLVSENQLNARLKIIDSEILGTAKIPHAKFDDRDANPYILDLDFNGKKRQANQVIAGPFANLKSGINRIKVF